MNQTSENSAVLEIHGAPQSVAVESPTTPNSPDHRTPLERFRTAPKKAFSVSDLVSPAWCELQYWYTLTKLGGRRKQTTAMKQGIAVHQVLEDQIYTTVKVDIKTKEDAFGLRIWNVIQGLRTLQTTGQTRELEVWGTIDGQFVNGVIDDISFTDPFTDQVDEMQNDELLATDNPPNYQTTISDYFQSSGISSTRQSNQSPKAYLCDVKTRSGRTLPRGAAFLPTKMQLMLYHRLLANLANNQVDFSLLAHRYNLQPDTPFSDYFITKVSSLNDEIFYDFPTNPLESDSTDQPPSSQDSLTILLNHNSLSQLWTLMINELQKTLPHGTNSIGDILKAEYRTRSTGDVIGSHTFAMDNQTLDTYIEHEMRWWKGERQPEGVSVEEAYKCQSCDFADNCEWRVARVEEATMRSRARKSQAAANRGVIREFPIVSGKS